MKFIRFFWSNKVRSGLTVLGIVIGIASVVAMISIGQGASYQIQSSIESLGSNLLTIIPGFVQPGRGIVFFGGEGSAQTLVNDDLEIIEKGSRGYLSFSGTSASFSGGCGYK
ncbi:MAG: hypothetical protein KatS3mg098_540 [Candidatus Parcubacteria bacterium]|nr:MAG: hypothetical protein KatS3mg098_540 [Candidatus Parcubacteria bacterium]